MSSVAVGMPAVTEHPAPTSSVQPRLDFCAFFSVAAIEVTFRSITCQSPALSARIEAAGRRARRTPRARRVLITRLRLSVPPPAQARAQTLRVRRKGHRQIRDYQTPGQD